MHTWFHVQLLIKKSWMDSTYGPATALILTHKIPLIKIQATKICHWIFLNKLVFVEMILYLTDGIFETVAYGVPSKSQNPTVLGQGGSSSTQLNQTLDGHAVGTIHLALTNYSPFRRSTKNQVPYARHYNLLLIRNRS